MTWLKYQEVLPIMPPYIRCFIDDLCSYAGSNHVLSWNTFLVVKTCLCNRNVCVQFSCIDCRGQRFPTKITSKWLTLFEHMIYWWWLLCCLKASLVLKHIRMCCRATYAYDNDIYELQVKVWNWKFSRTGCRESGFLPDGWPQCDLLL